MPTSESVFLTRKSLFPSTESKETSSSFQQKVNRRPRTAEDTRNRQRWNRALFERLEHLKIEKPKTKNKMTRKKIKINRSKKTLSSKNISNRRKSSKSTKKRMSLPKGLTRPSTANSAPPVRANKAGKATMKSHLQKIGDTRYLSRPKRI